MVNTKDNYIIKYFISGPERNTGMSRIAELMKTFNEEFKDNLQALCIWNKFLIKGQRRAKTIWSTTGLCGKCIANPFQYKMYRLQKLQIIIHLGVDET